MLWYTIGYLQVCDLRWKLTTKWNCGDNNLYLYVILILNDLEMLWYTIGYLQVCDLCWKLTTICCGILFGIHTSI